MKVLVIGGGGREHALLWKLARSPRQPQLYCAPGNPGTATLALNVSLAADDVDGLLAFAEREGIDLTLVGPEAPLLAGIVDAFAGRGLRIFGPTRAAARIEGSKAYAKALMARVGVPTARYGEFTDYDEALTYLHAQGAPIVVKADGLAAGKGVVVAETLAEAEHALGALLLDGTLGASGRRVLLEEYLVGREVSLMAFVSDETVLMMAPAQDHKPIFDDNRGPNTGGMRAYSPVPWLDAATLAQVEREIMRPIAAALRTDGAPFRGVLFAGLMLTEAGPRVLEFNARFGDPETQVVLPRLETDLIEIVEATIAGDLAALDLAWSPEAAVCVVLSAEGYPGAYRTGDTITGLDEVPQGVVVFQAGTAQPEGEVLTAGGRVLGVTGQGPTLAAAREAAYRAVAAITFNGRHYRSDIALEAAHSEE